MNTFEITIQRRHNGICPVVVRHQAGSIALTTWAHGVFDLDLKQLDGLYHTDRQYGLLLGQNIFRADLRDAFVRALSGAKTASEPLRVLLIIEAEDLRSRHWEQLFAPFEGGRWDHLLLNQGTPFSLYLPSQIARRFPPIGRRDMRALLLVAGPEELAGDYGLDPFDVPATVESLRASLGQIPHDVLATSVERAAGEPTLETLCAQLTATHYTLLFIICHGVYREEEDETILYFPEGERRRPVTGSQLITRLSRLEAAQGLPHFTFLSTCDSADPRAENGLGGLGQRLVRELGMPAVLAMTGRISIQTAQALSTAFCTRLGEHGEVDRALAEALTALQGRYDVTVPALFSRLGGWPLFSDALDRPLTASEIRSGLEKTGELLQERAPVLLDECQSNSRKIQAGLDADPTDLSPEARREFETALAAANQLCSQALDISFNALALGQEPPQYDPRCPFRGLYPFRAEDREFFFGRQTLVDQLSTRLNDHPFLAVLGPSGCGKSSLVLAGLIHALEVPMAYLTPGSDPPVQLEAALESSRADSVLVVDQFEELFTLCRDEAGRQAFLERLLSTAGEMRVVITMRADFLGECAAYPDLRDAIEAHQALVGPMSAAELRRAMERQADHVGLRFEAGLGEQILDDVRGEPGAMPLLQHALLLLWQRRHGRWLRWEEYTAIGGIREAIAHTAEEVYAGLRVNEKTRVRDIFIRLTRPPEVEGSKDGARYTRRRARLRELVPAGSDWTDTTLLVNRLADARLVVTKIREETADVEVEVAHEALIQHWPRLLNWLDENRADILLREALTQTARDWESLNRDPGTLYRGARLAQAIEWEEKHSEELNVLEKEFLVASQEREQREQSARERQRNRVLISALAIAILMTILGLFALNRSQVASQQAATATYALREAVHAQETAETRRMEADAQRATAQAASTHVAEERNLAATAQANAEQQARLSRAGELAAFTASQLDQDIDLALLLSVEAFRSADIVQTKQVLFQSLTHNPQLNGLIRGHNGWIESVDWSSDGRLASGSGDRTVIIWDLENGKPSQTFQGHSGSVKTVAWSPDGRLASGSVDGQVIIWDLESGQPAQTLQVRPDPVESVAWSLDGRLASGSWDRTVIVWDLESGMPSQTLQGHSDSVESVAWSSDGGLASGSRDGTVIIWNLESGKPSQILHGHSGSIQIVAWSPDGRLASGSLDGQVIVWDLESSQPALTLQGHSDAVGSVAWSQDGRLASGSWDRNIIVWDLESSQPTLTLQGHSDAIESLAWSQDGRLASGSRDVTVGLWNLESAQPALTLQGLGDQLVEVSWSPDGRLASGSVNGQVLVWNLKSSQPALTLHGHSGSVQSVAWSQDGRLATGFGDGTVIIWNLVSGHPAQTLQDHSSSVTSLAWSPDGRLASASAGDLIIIRDLSDGKSVQTLRRHSITVNSLAWSPEGRLASGLGDGTVVIWDLEKGQLARTLQGTYGFCHKHGMVARWTPSIRVRGPYSHRLGPRKRSAGSKADSPLRFCHQLGLVVRWTPGLRVARPYSHRLGPGKRSTSPNYTRKRSASFQRCLVAGWASGHKGSDRYSHMGDESRSMG